MFRKTWVIAVAALAGMAVLGIIAPAAGAQETLTQRNFEASDSGQVGDVMGHVCPVGLQAIPLGIKCTVNIPAVAFGPDGISSGWYISFNGGYIQGSSGGAALVAPIIFPKGAKHIQHIDIFVRDTNGGNSATLGVRRADPWSSSGTTAIVDFATQSYSGNLVKYVCTPTDRNIYSNHVYFVTAWAFSGAYIYGVIVYYSTL